MAMGKEIWGIRLEDCNVGYPGLVVLEGLNASLPPGKISVILGGSGCGKSTLLRHVLGLSKPTHGKIFIGEKDLFELRPRDFRSVRRRMGVLFQDGALLGSLTLGENVALPLKERTSLPAAKVREIALHKLSLVGLEEFAGYYPGQLSGGMRKRGGLARAIVMDPPVLLCDEPTSGLDPINAAQMDALLLDMNNRFNVTVVVVSHDLQSLYATADHVLVLHDGRAVFDGSLEALKQSDDPYIRQFLDRRPDGGMPSGDGTQDRAGA